MADGSKSPKAPVVEELIIVRRNQPEEAGHKGGAWKIAYADFVTAMMAFFLVMWLINAANEKTKAQVASYFNPVKLVDNTTSAKGIRTPGDRTAKSSGEKGGEVTPSEAPATTEEAKAAAASEAKSENAPPPEHKPESEKKASGGGTSAEEIQMFDDPFRTLAQIARQAPPVIKGKSDKIMVIKETEQVPSIGGDSTRDPFDPLAWKLVVPPEEEGAGPLAKKEKAAPQDKTVDTAEKEQPADKEQPAGKEQPAEKAAPDEKSAADGLSPEARLAVQEAEKIRSSLSVELAALGTKHPDLHVKTTKEGVLISLTDSTNFDMFDVGSARPRPVVVKLMEKLAAAVKDFKGHIIVRGHTDGRPYRGSGYDNWRLSMARAQMAYYMLIRAGVEESAVERIEGYADKSLLNNQDAMSAENRRIEILLKVSDP